MAPQYTCVSRSGATARNQSYHAWLVLTPGGGATAVHVPPARRQRKGVVPTAPHAYATPGFDRAIATAKRSKEPGAPGSATAVHVVPPFVDRRSPSLHA